MDESKRDYIEQVWQAEEDYEAALAQYRAWLEGLAKKVAERLQSKECLHVIASTADGTGDFRVALGLEGPNVTVTERIMATHPDVDDLAAYIAEQLRVVR